MIRTKSEAEIKKMEYAGKVSYEVLMDLKDFIKEGVTTKEIDKFIYDEIVSKKCTPAFLKYEGFPASACISVNNEIVHGIPSDRKLISGDIVTVDLGAKYKKYNSDTAYTYIIGEVSGEVSKLVSETRRALYKGMSVVKSGISLDEIGSAIESVAKENHYAVFKELTGHGVGKTLHEDPYVPNYSCEESKSIILKEGMTIAIEPMFGLKSDKVWIEDNGWTITTQDGSFSAHFEHTILVTKNGYKIMTGE